MATSARRSSRLNGTALISRWRLRLRRPSQRWRNRLARTSYSRHTRRMRGAAAQSRLFVEIRVEDANLGDLRDRQFVTGRGTADCLRRGSVEDAEGALSIGRDVGMNPRNAILGVVIDDFAARPSRNGVVASTQSPGRLMDPQRPPPAFEVFIIRHDRALG